METTDSNANTMASDVKHATSRLEETAAGSRGRLIDPSSRRNEAAELIATLGSFITLGIGMLAGFAWMVRRIDAVAPVSFDERDAFDIVAGYRRRFRQHGDCLRVSEHLPQRVQHLLHALRGPFLLFDAILEAIDLFL